MVFEEAAGFQSLHLPFRPDLPLSSFSHLPLKHNFLSFWLFLPIWTGAPVKRQITQSRASKPINLGPLEDVPLPMNNYTHSLTSWQCQQNIATALFLGSGEHLLLLPLPHCWWTNQLGEASLA